MKVLLASPLPPPVGGIATVTANLIGYLQSEPVKVELVLCNTTIKFRSITSESIFLRIYSGLNNSIRTFNSIKNTVKNESPQLIHLASSSSFSLFKDYLIILIAKYYKIPMVIHWHFGRIPQLAAQNNWEWRLFKFVIKKSTLSIVIDSRSFITLRNAGINNVVNIPNPLGLDTEHKARSVFGKTYQRKHGSIIFVGHIVRNKGVYELVEACSRLLLITSLTLIGPSEENVKKELISIASKRSKGRWLKFAGELNKDQVLESMLNTPILALPSYTEGFPNAVLEGMAMGCAVIGSDVGAIPEMLNVGSDRPCGICVRAHHVENLITAILELVQYPIKTEMMGKNGIDRVMNNYTIDKIATEYISIWEKAICQYIYLNPNMRKDPIHINSLFQKPENGYSANQELNINVLLVAPLPPPIGGIASWTPNIIKYFFNSQHNISLTLLNSALKGKSITSNSLIKRYYSGIYNFLWIIFEFRKLIRVEKPELIHLVSSSSLALYKDYFLIKLAKKLKIPVVTHWRFGRIPMLANQNNWEWKLLKHVILKSTVSIVIDSRSYKTLRNAGFNNIVNIPNPLGLDIEEKSRAHYGKSNQRKQGRVIFVGHIVRSKGVYELVEACTQLPIIKELSLIGPSEQYVRDELRAIAGKRDNGNWLSLNGELNKGQVLEQMFTSPVLVLPSYTEGFPNAVLEGMSMGCAIIASDVGAIPEMLDVQSSKPCGICVPPRQVEWLRKTIIQLMQEPAKIEAMGKNGINRVLNYYTMKKIAEQYINVWKAAANGSEYIVTNN